MNFIDICLLSVALAMDCFAVSIVCGVLARRYVWRIILQVGVLFGLFQALMPFAGWLCTNYFAGYVEAVDHWVAFGLLAFLGVRMIKESFGEEGDCHYDPSRLRTQVVLAVATSIDALAVGVSFSCLGYREMSQLAMPLVVIGLVSFAFAVAGNLLGVRFGKAIQKRLKAELIGGVILIFIGFKVLLSHTGWLQDSVPL